MSGKKLWIYSRLAKEQQLMRYPIGKEVQVYYFETNEDGNPIHPTLVDPSNE
jgi:hypothetical protein